MAMMNEAQVAEAIELARANGIIVADGMIELSGNPLIRSAEKLALKAYGVPDFLVSSSETSPDNPLVAGAKRMAREAAGVFLSSDPVIAERERRELVTRLSRGSYGGSSETSTDNPLIASAKRMAAAAEAQRLGRPIPYPVRIPQSQPTRPSGVDLQLSGGTGTDWLVMASATVFESIPRQRFRKEVVRIGKYVKDATGQAFNITRDVLQNWVFQFQRMRKNGVKVPIPSTHEGASDPDKIRGVVEDLFIDGDSLVMTCELVGEDGIAAAARNDVSLGSPPDFTDGHGNQYPQPILHVALCPDPVIPGLGDFIPIAASRSA